jgi:hypothetical protein
MTTEAGRSILATNKQAVIADFRPGDEIPIELDP